MELAEIEIFLASAEKGSFSAASRALYISHSTVSRAICALEESLGVRLFLRDGHGVRLTEAGQELYSRGAELLTHAREVARLVQEKGEHI